MVINHKRTQPKIINIDIYNDISTKSLYVNFELMNSKTYNISIKEIIVKKYSRLFYKKVKDLIWRPEDIKEYHPYWSNEALRKEFLPEYIKNNKLELIVKDKLTYPLIIPCKSESNKYKLIIKTTVGHCKYHFKT